MWHEASLDHGLDIAHDVRVEALELADDDIHDVEHPDRRRPS